MKPTELHRTWTQRARMVSIRHNLATLLACFLPTAFIVSAAFACALLVLRKNDAVTPNVWIVFSAVLLLAMLGSALFSRRQFFTKNDALVRLEIVLKLRNQLSAAAAGIGAWPNLPAQSSDGFTWRWQKILPPIAGSILLVAAALSIPLQRDHTSFRNPTEQPRAWSEVQAWIDTLAQSKLVQEPALEKLREALSDLRKQPSEKWYSHSSLEAGDNLRQQSVEALRSLERDLQQSASALSVMPELVQMERTDDLKAANDALQKALQGLELGNLPLNKDLLAKLRDIDPANIKRLTPEQLRDLLDRLKNGGELAKDMLGDADAAVAAFLAENGENAGMPGVSRGPGSPPLTLNENPSELGSHETVKLQNDDLTHASPGEMMGISKGEHEVDPTKYRGPGEAGTIQSAAQGGEAVWRNSLTPKERETLKRFFK